MHKVAIGLGLAALAVLALSYAPHFVAQKPEGVIRHTTHARATAPTVERSRLPPRVAALRGYRAKPVEAPATLVLTKPAPDEFAEVTALRAQMVRGWETFRGLGRPTPEQERALLVAIWDAQEALRLAREAEHDLRTTVVVKRKDDDLIEAARVEQEALADELARTKYDLIEADLDTRVKELLTPAQFDVWTFSVFSLDLAGTFLANGEPEWKGGA